MKSLKLTILLEQGVSKAELMNVFGQYYELTGTNRYAQFSFPSVRMLTALQLKPIHDLLTTYEQKKPLRFKFLHLADDEDGSFSPVYLQCYEGIWSIAASNGVEMKSSTNLFNLI